MEFRELSTFLQVAKLQSFSKAAKVLGYSQAAVTIQIKQLEQELGVHLFDRIGKQTSLTHQGSVFYEYAASIMRDIAQAKDAITFLCMAGYFVLLNVVVHRIFHFKMRWRFIHAELSWNMGMFSF